MPNLDLECFREINIMVHMLNHTQVNRVCKLSENQIEDELIPVDFSASHHIEGLKAGLYLVDIEDQQYILHLGHDLDSAEYVSIRRNNNCYYLYDHNRKVIPMYRFNGFIPESSKDASFTIDTVNSFLCAVVIFAYDESNESIEGSSYPDNIYKLPKINTLQFSTNKADDPKEHHSLRIPLKYALRSINDYADYVVIESETCIARYVLKIDELILTGNEQWEWLKDFENNDDLAVFFLPIKDMKKEDSKTLVRCNFLTTVSEDQTDLQPYQIFGYTNNDKIGVCVTIPKETDTDEDDLDIFKSILLNKLMTDAARINYVLEKPISRVDYIDEYHIHTFYRNTEIKTNWDYGCHISYFYKTIDNSLTDERIDL